MVHRADEREIALRRVQITVRACDLGLGQHFLLCGEEVGVAEFFDRNWIAPLLSRLCTRRAPTSRDYFASFSVIPAGLVLLGGPTVARSLVSYSAKLAGKLLPAMPTDSCNRAPMNRRFQVAPDRCPAVQHGLNVVAVFDPERGLPHRPVAIAGFASPDPVIRPNANGLFRPRVSDHFQSDFA